MVKYINIFGNDIFYKLKLAIGNNELKKIINDRDELIQEMKKYEIDRCQKLKESNILLNKIKIYNKNLQLSPLKKCINNNNNEDYRNYFSPTFRNNKNTLLMRSSSQSKLVINNKTKLKPLQQV